MRRLLAIPGWTWPAGAIILLWAGISLHLLHEHRQAIDDARTEGTNLARAFRESMVRTIRAADQALLFVRALHQRDGTALDLTSWAETGDPELHLAAQIALADRTGLVIYSNLRPLSGQAAAPAIDIASRPHFRHFADMPPDAPDRDQLYISAPVIGRLSGLRTIQFVRRLETPDGAFNGVAVLSISPSLLTRSYAAIDLGAGGSVTLAGLDGIVRAEIGSAPRAPETPWDSPVLALARDQPEGHADWHDPARADTRIDSFARIPGFPLVVAVGFSRAEKLTDFTTTRNALLTGGAILSLLLGLAGWSTICGQGQLARARATQRVALENIGQGLIMVSPAGRIAVMNRRAVELLDIPPRFGVGSDFDALVAWQRVCGEFSRGTPEPVREQIYADSRPDRSLPQRYKRQRPNGTWLEIQTALLPDGTSVRTFSDVSAWEQNQVELTLARDAAEAAGRARAQFLAVMSHEIRTPLNGILGISELLESAGLPDEPRDHVRIIRQSGQHLLDLLNDILDFSKFEQGRIALESIAFDPRLVLGSAVNILAPRAQEHGLTLTALVAADCPALVLGDPHRLRQILLNLIGNAIKFTPSGGVEVTLRSTPQNPGQRLDFAVRDTGIGMAQEVQSRLFEEFTQMDGSITRRFGGSGLGLAISRRLVEAMGGAILVESQEGIGSTFRFHVHAASAPDAGDQDDPDDSRDINAARTLIARRAPHLLLAEDNRVNRIVASRMAESLGCTVETVENGHAAVEQVATGRFDLVLMDVMMPEMDGLAATRAIRALPGPACHTPVIGWSANAFRSDEQTAMEAGMNGFVTKPATTHTLALELARVLEAAPRADTAPPPPPGNPALDELAQILGPDGIAMVVGAFLDETPGQFAHMRSLAVQGDAPALAREAHAMAGSAGTLGSTALEQALRDLERGLRAGTLTAEPSCLNAVAPLLADATAELARIRADAVAA